MRTLLAAGHEVRALARKARDIPIEDARLEKRDGDALDRATVEQALSGVDAVVQSLGVAFSPEVVLKGGWWICSSEGYRLGHGRVLPLVHADGTSGRTADDCRRLSADRHLLRLRARCRDYNLMGPVKAALESAVRYTAAELAPKGIRVHAISPGPIRTRAASGIDRFDELIAAAAATAPSHHLVDVDDVGALAAFLVSDGARHITGTIIPVDGGQHLS